MPILPNYQSVLIFPYRKVVLQTVHAHGNSDYCEESICNVKKVSNGKFGAIDPPALINAEAVFLYKLPKCTFSNSNFHLQYSQMAGYSTIVQLLCLNKFIIFFALMS